MERGVTPSSFSTFGDLLRFLRRRARLTQRELGIAVGYSEAHIARLERGRRLPDPAMVKAQFVPVLQLDGESDLSDQLVRLAEMAHGLPPSQSNLSRSSGDVDLNRQTNLPAQLTRFIGREHDMLTVERLVSENRLVTLTGPGGMGKTRLAVEVGASLVKVAHQPPPQDDQNDTTGTPPRQSFPDGVWLVELATVMEAESVSRAVAEVFRLPGEPGHNIMELLVAHLQHAHLLLILDGCEHLVAACADLAERLLILCPALHILVTSREAMRISGEVNWRVQPLTTPGRDDPAALEHALDYPAVQLFVEHASASQPALQLTPESMEAIVHICRRLDGIPLAIEMAAAQVAVMSPQEIASHLGDRFALLSNERRTVSPHQRTLHATIEWSYQLLSPRERTLLDRLSVFVDGFTASAAQAVCADPSEALGIEDDAMDGSRAANALAEHLAVESLRAVDVVPLLVELVNKSLVVADTRGSQTRYRLLRTIRQFARDELTALGQRDAIHERLALYFMSLARSRASGGEGPPATEWLNLLQAEVGNIRALMTWARGLSDGARTSLTLSTALSALWVSRGYLAEASAWLEEALVRGVDAPPGLRAEALNGLLRLLAFRGYNLSRWSASADETFALAEQIDSPTEACESFYWAGHTALHRAYYPAAYELFARGLKQALRIHYSHGTVVASAGMGWARLKVGDREGANTLFRKALCLADEYGCQLAPDAPVPLASNSALVIGAASHFDACSVISGLCLTDLPAAMATCVDDEARLRASPHAGGAPHTEDYALTQELHSELLLIQGDYAAAQAGFVEAHELWRTLGVTWNMGHGTARTTLNLGQVAWLLNQPATAADWYRQSLELCRRAGDRERVARLHILIGYTHLSRADSSTAAETLEQGLRLYQELGQPAGIALALVARAALEEASGHLERAARLYGAAADRDVLLTWVAGPADGVIHDREVRLARVRYAGTPFEAIWAAGATMSLDEAVHFALE